MEYADGGMPGNSFTREASEQLAKLGDDIPELIATYGDDIVPLLLQYGDDADDVADGEVARDFHRAHFDFDHCVRLDVECFRCHARRITDWLSVVNINPTC